MSGELLLLSGRVITMDPARPIAEALAVRRGRIVAAGSDAECRTAAAAGARVIDCGGRTVVPGFIDAHIHLAAYAAAIRAVDCARARSIAGIARLITDDAAHRPAGAWVRAASYDESALEEGRHPTRWELDAAAPHHPVRLVHRSGHAIVLNSRAMALAGISITSEEPPGAVIDRRLTDGEPTGLLLEMGELVSRVVPPLSRAELRAGMQEAGRRLVAAGVTAVQDMTHTNTPDMAGFLMDLTAESGFGPRLLAPATGWHESLHRAAGDERAGAAGPIKLLLRETGERPVPDGDAVSRIIRICTDQQRQVAIHAVERRTVAEVIDAFERAGNTRATARLRHRIEHVGVCPPDLAERIAALGVVAVSNPGFLPGGAARYRRHVTAADLPHLYAVGALHGAGVRVAAGSDAPVASPEPLAAIQAAITRRGDGGVLPGIPAAPMDALAMYTTAAAFAAHYEDDTGRLAPGMRADLTVLRGMPGDPETRVEMTIIDGIVTWQHEDVGERV